MIIKPTGNELVIGFRSSDYGNTTAYVIKMVCGKVFTKSGSYDWQYCDGSKLYYDSEKSAIEAKISKAQGEIDRSIERIEILKKQIGKL